MVLGYSSCRILILRGLDREVMSDFVLLTDYSCAVWEMDLGECKFGGREACLWEWKMVAWMESSDGGEGI